MSLSRLSPLVLALLCLPLMQCKCDDTVVPVDACGDVPGVQQDNQNTCSANSDCADHFSCLGISSKQGLKCCVKADRPCTTEGDCCPSQECTTTFNRCADKRFACENDEQCGSKGDMFCEAWTDGSTSEKRCRFKPCGALGQCVDGQSCFNGECMADLPCGGACEAGKACVPTSNRCQAFACPASCAPGFIATFKDARDIWDTCNRAAAECVCAELPGLASKDMGRYSAVAADPTRSELLVSVYDGQYGDLVVRRYDAAGKLAGQVYVDGVPAGGEVKYGPSGPRGGSIEPGEDVGRYTSIAVGAEQAYVSYHDFTNGDLKLAVRNGEEWSHFRVDGASADLGLYSSLAIDSDGMVGIAYYQRGGSASFDATSCPGTAPAGDKSLISALKFARATKVNPTSATDFSIKTLACLSRPAPLCASCSGTQVCADPGTGTPSCYAAATTCTATCDSSTEACVRVGTANSCARVVRPPNLLTIPEGVGVFPSLAFKGKEAFIAYMRRTNSIGSLYGVRVSATGTATTPVLLDGKSDTGYFPNLKIHPGTGLVQVAYHDNESGALKFYSNASFVSTATPEVIDTGLGPTYSGEQGWAGTDSAILYAPQGNQLFVVYQDPTRGDLKLATKKTGWEKKLAPVRTEGTVGFYADGAFLGSDLFFTHARIHARRVEGAPVVDNALLVDKYSASP